MRILVTGASGFAGSELIPRLLSDEHAVRALARDPARVDLQRISSDTLFSHKLDILTGDILSGVGLAPALRDVEVAYYLIHSMESSPAGTSVTDGRATPFPERERIAATHFAAAASAAAVRRIVYLGGPTTSWLATGEHVEEREAEHTREPRGGWPGGRPAEGLDSGDSSALSPHLRSREAVERILREAVPDTLALRASIVIGARSRSFRLLVRLLERMPVLALPAWRTQRTRPIDARDIVDMLAAAATVPSVEGESLDVGGPDLLSYGEMIRRIADLMMLARPAVGLGVNATSLTARLAAAIAGEDPELVGALMGSLQSDLLPGGPSGSSHLHAAELLGVDLHSFDAAVERSLRQWESFEPLAAR